MGTELKIGDRVRIISRGRWSILENTATVLGFGKGINGGKPSSFVRLKLDRADGWRDGLVNCWDLSLIERIA